MNIFREMYIILYTFTTTTTTTTYLKLTQTVFYSKLK